MGMRCKSAAALSTIRSLSGYGWEDGRKVESKPGDQPAATVTRIFGGEMARDSTGV